MKKVLIHVFCMQMMCFAIVARGAVFAPDRTEIVDGVLWHYIKDSSSAVIQSPNINNIRGGNNCTLLPAHEGKLPKVLTIPNKLGGLNVWRIETGSIQLSMDSGVELIIVPSTVRYFAKDAIIGEFVKSESTTRYYSTSYKWFVKNASEHGLRGVLFLGNYHYMYESTGSSIDVDGHASHISQQDSAVFVPANDAYSSLWPQVYYVEGILEPYEAEIRDGVRYGAAKVEITPAGGVYEEGVDVSLACTNSTANIYYTLDGGDPTTNVTDRCFLYNEPITLTHAATVKALAHVAEHPYTVVYSERYALGQTLVPSIVAADGDVFNWSGNVVTLATETEYAEIRYTLDGSEPTESSRLYTGPFAIDDTTTVKAKAFKEDWFESETATATFTREWYTVDAPVIEPSGAAFENVSQTVSLSCATEGAMIFYTTDGSDPKVNGREYTKPFTIYKTCTVRAIAVKYDWKDSAEATATFTRGESLSEAANLYGYTMETDSVAPWTVDAAVSHDGVSSVRSGAIGNDGTTYLMASVKKAGTVSFWWKVQCEEPDEEDGEDGYYDYGAFLVDNVVVARIAGHDGEWHYVSHEVTSGGKHTLKWEYRKDGATSYAPDCVWLDQVQWTPADGSGFTMTTPEQVPYAWLCNYGFGGREADFETAANAPSGKHDGAGRTTSVWEEWVAGTDPTNAASRFEAKIEMRDGVPIVTWEPDLNTNGVIRTYKVYGKESLADAVWAYPTNSLHRFFKVTVEMP